MKKKIIKIFHVESLVGCWQRNRTFSLRKKTKKKHTHTQKRQYTTRLIIINCVYKYIKIYETLFINEQNLLNHSCNAFGPPNYIQLAVPHIEFHIKTEMTHLKNDVHNTIYTRHTTQRFVCFMIVFLRNAEAVRANPIN